MKIVARSGALGVYRIEIHRGTCAIINGGVGSCTSQHYLQQFWEENITAVQPNIVLAQAHTINCWFNHFFHNNMKTY